MDGIVDYEAYEQLKTSYDQLVDNNRLLESDNESLTACNKVLKRLLETLETIKTSLEQKVHIIAAEVTATTGGGTGGHQLVPFDRELQRDLTPGAKKFRCHWNDCQYATDSSGNFQKHYRIHTGEKPYRCDFQDCKYRYNPGSIKEHKRTHSAEKQYGCDWEGCTWRFSTYKLLKNHKRACHTLDKPHKCDWPGMCTLYGQWRRSRTDPSFCTHLYNLFVCVFNGNQLGCEKSYLAPYQLRGHKHTHTGDRPHRCDMIECQASFARPTGAHTTAQHT
ncbi:unnamed protein product, partial [Medioppia subpectinata]